MKNKASDDTSKSVKDWNEFTKTKSFDAYLNSDNFNGSVVPAWLDNKELRLDAMMGHDIKSIRPLLKPLLIDTAYKKLLKSFRNYKAYKSQDKITVRVDKNAINQLNKVMLKLGLNQHDDSYSAAIDWLSAPNVKDEPETQRALFDAYNNNDYVEFGDAPARATFEQMQSLKARLPLKDQEFIAKLIEYAFVDGWKAKGKTRSDNPDRISEKLNESELYNNAKSGLVVTRSC